MTPSDDTINGAGEGISVPLLPAIKQVDNGGYDYFGCKIKAFLTVCLSIVEPEEYYDANQKCHGNISAAG
jgi:hypothetical protein